MKVRMKHAIAVTLVGATSCAWAGHFSQFNGKFDCENIGNSFQCARRIEANLNATFLSRTDAGRLDVMRSNGQAYSFVDVQSDDGAARRYSALDASPDGRYVTIQTQLYEGESFGILDRKYGVFTRFSGYPEFSPDSRWLAVANGGEDQPSILRIFAVTDGRFRLSVDAKPATWPDDVQWRSAELLTYEHSASLAVPRDPAQAVVLEKIQLNGRRWVVSEP